LLIVSGCKYSEKQSFLTDLLNVLKVELEEYALNNSTDHRYVPIELHTSLTKNYILRKDMKEVS